MSTQGFGKIGYLPNSSLALDYVFKVGCTFKSILGNNRDH